MTTLRLVLSLIGILPVLFAGWYWIQRWQRGRHLLAFSRTTPIDLVLTTSAVSTAVHGLPASRPLTGYGQVRAVASCAKALASHYPRKEVCIHLSGFVRNRLDRDLIILGGPAKNEVAKAFIKDLPSDYFLDELVFDDEADVLRVAIGASECFAEQRFAPEMLEGYPVNDLGLIIAARRGVHGEHGRAILCAGLTTYGTAAAAEYLFGDMVKLPRRHLKERMGLNVVRSAGDFLVVVKARFSRGECTEVRPVFETRLRRRA